MVGEDPPEGLREPVEGPIPFSLVVQPEDPPEVVSLEDPLPLASHQGGPRASTRRPRGPRRSGNSTFPSSGSEWDEKCEEVL